MKATIDCRDIKLPCGRCIGCRLERSRQWAVRLVHEKRFHEESSFVTLTYDEKHLPKDGSLNVKHFQDFMKRLRKDLGKKIRFFHAGEYGEKRGRPHYHAIIFGESFRNDRYAEEKTENEDITWQSRRLDKLWPFGMHVCGDVTFESCAYVARYITKKVTGKRAEEHYERVMSDGEIIQLKPEYCTMSRRPGIGADHFHLYKKEIYLRDEIISRGISQKPPRFYDKLLAKENLSQYEELKALRESALSQSPRLKSEAQLCAAETIKLAQISTLKRRYEIS